MTPMDLLHFNPCNLDHLTETYNIGFYLEYFTKWPSLCKVYENEKGEIEAYSTHHHQLPSLTEADVLQSSAKSNRLPTQHR